MTTAAVTRKSLAQFARAEIRGSVTNPQAIRAGLVIAACRCLTPAVASAIGCAKAADDLANILDGMYTNSPTLAPMLARLVARRDWQSLWTVARREAYPNVCR